ncbi:hypothetical protein CCACVL1_02815 [Corchorus capsularis]|uniref:Uncharacterized protein n=1 Tax=Corchorus capsularis TaxID=210143 RepID=A0A1R3K5M5_COCAP|nr:hypothetical protein CCACVL1_02815 [Corchorus capsularis]
MWFAKSKLIRKRALMGPRKTRNNKCSE